VIDEPTLVYLEADDEITAVVRRVRAADAARVVVVAPGRARATSSAVALRLLARVGGEEGRQVVVVGDALTRSLAVEAGLPAFGTVDEARDASLDAPVPVAEEPRHAAIHVVRGAATDDTVATPVVEAAAQPRPGAMDETRAVPVRRPAPPAPAGRTRTPARSRRRSLGLAAVLGLVGALLVAGIVAGATLLPTATVTIVPRSVPVNATYELIVADPDRESGTVEARAAIVASGSYEVLEPGGGTVTFRNFNIGTVEVPAGTLVAAGEQAFETTETVAVPSGSLTSSGTIAAGEGSAPVLAAAPGPGGNVEAGAIDTVLSRNVAARLRGFPQNNARLVINAEPTTGGVDASGPEITEADVDAAVVALRAELRRLADAASPDPGGGRLAVETDPEEPAIEVPEDLVGTRDVPETEIAGTLAWEVVVVDPDDLEDEAAGRLASDPLLPEGHDLRPESVSVELGAPVLRGGEVVVAAAVDALTTPRIERDEILARIIGRSAPEAELALADLGEADVTLWPGWVATVPELEFRVDVRVEAQEP
jgi:hypothetical protein